MGKFMFPTVSQNDRYVNIFLSEFSPLPNRYNMSFMKSPGEILRIMREVAGLSQSELEKLAGMPQGRISHIETGHRGIGPKARQQLAQAFGLSLEEFLRVLNESRGDKRFIEIWLKIHKLSEPNCNKITQGIIHLLDMVSMANGHSPSRGIIDNLLLQIENYYELSKKMIPPCKE
jgi:transcriptional regulator with XRE-family HTH domain